MSGGCVALRTRVASRAKGESATPGALVVGLVTMFVGATEKAVVVKVAHVEGRKKAEETVTGGKSSCIPNGGGQGNRGCVGKTMSHPIGPGRG